MMRPQDRRKFIRLKAHHLVKYKRISETEEDSPSVIATIKDIGAGGVCLVTEEYLPVSTVIELKINFPHVSTSIFSLARIVWIKHKKKTNRYEAGAQFFEIDESARRFLDDQIKSVYQKVDQKGGLLKLLKFIKKERKEEKH